MALTTKAYDFSGPDDEDLDACVQIGSVATDRLTGATRIIIQFDDSTSGAEDAADDFMAVEGFFPAAAVQSAVMMQSPDGTVWVLSIDNLGVLSTDVRV